ETVSTATFGVHGERAYGEQSPLEEDAFAAALEEEFDLDLGSALILELTVMAALIPSDVIISRRVEVHNPRKFHQRIIFVHRT
ncbi:hypothetical protein H7D62_016615, partial [Brucella melitensis]|uniref:hypothetical protein n=1 Tax=Brucella melitensis TaxID=29459 RepID=UPI001AA013D2